MSTTDDLIDRLQADNKELRAYLKCFLRATIDPDENGKDIGVHEANPTIDWQFVVVEDHIDGRRITGGQIRRAAELIGYDKLGIEPATRTISEDLAETAELRRQRVALRAVITGMILAIQGRSLIGNTASKLREIADTFRNFTDAAKVRIKRRADFLDEAVEMGNNILEQTKKE